VTIATPLAELLQRLNGPRVPELERAIARLCTALEEGHVCLPASELGVDAGRLRTCPVVGTAGEFKPLILDAAGRLYLHRYWRYESELAQALIARANAPFLPCQHAVLSAGLERYFAGADPAQRDAAAAFVRRSLSILTGGPGTGKTQTATIALVLLAEQFAAVEKRPRVALAAPTGKAAARLAESLTATLERLALPPALRALLPTGATTLHRLLGGRAGSAQFRHGPENPLLLDALIVDEASMVDLPMMAKLFSALRPTTRVLLLGDPHQLASVEAGHVLGDLCASPLRAGITELTTNHRFSDASGIYQLSRAVKLGDEKATRKLLTAPPVDLVSASLPAPSAIGAALRERVLAGFRGYLAAATPAKALEAFGAFRILCALREGPYGVGHLNRLAEQALADARLIHPESVHYAGRPILILRNDYQLGLFNGDVGVLRHADDGELRAYFPGEIGGVRSFAPARLPEHETAFAMTVHKTQGSEFTRVLIVLPEAGSPILSRELLYTAVTRAREGVELWWNEASLAASLARRVMRWSGLAERLGASGKPPKPLQMEFSFLGRK
jgi:exodeoxyribonuclease V alpha subunit